MPQNSPLVGQLPYYIGLNHTNHLPSYSLMVFEGREEGGKGRKGKGREGKGKERKEGREGRKEGRGRKGKEGKRPTSNKNQTEFKPALNKP